MLPQREDKQEVLTRDQRLARRADYKIQLEKIREEAIELDNYQLNEDQKRYLKLLIRMLIYLIDEMDRMVTLDYCYSFPFHDLPYGQECCIHLENYGAFTEHDAHDPNFGHRIRIQTGEKYKGDKCEDAILNSLHVTFLIAYNNVKNAGPNEVRVFCGKLGGAACIDGRTRDAFDYGLSFGKGAVPQFSDILTICLSKLHPAKQNNYNWIVASIVEHAWMKAYSADKGENSIITRHGIFDAQAFGVKPTNPEEKPSAHAGDVDRYIRQLNTTPSIELMTAISMVSPNKRERYLKIMLAQIEFSEGNIFEVGLPPARFNGTKAEEAYKKARNTKQNNFDTFFLNYIEPLVNLLKSQNISGETFNKLMQTASPAAITQFWKDNIIMDSWNIPQAIKQLIIENMLTKVENNENAAKLLLTSPNKRNAHLLFFVIKEHYPAPIIKRINQIGITHKLNLRTLKSGYNSPLSYILDNYYGDDRVEKLDLLLPPPGEETALEPQEAEEIGNVVLRAAKSKQWNCVSRLCDIKPDLTVTDNWGDNVLMYALYDNQREIISKLLASGANINQEKSDKTALIAATSHKSNLESFAAILSDKTLDLSYNDQGKRALHSAVELNSTEKTLLLLAQKNIDTSEAVNYSTYIYTSASNIVLLFCFIQHLLDPDYEFTRPENLTFLSYITEENINGVYGAILHSQQCPHLNSADWVLRKAMAYKGYSTQPIRELRFSNDQLDDTLTKYNKLFFLARQDKTWEHDVRREAEAQLYRDIQIETDPNTKKAILLEAKEAPVFALARASTLFKSTTTTQNRIQAMLNGLEKEQKNEGPKQ